MAGSRQPGPLGSGETGGSYLNERSMGAMRSASPSVVGGRRQPEEHPPKYHFLNPAHFTSCRPADDLVYFWHTVIAGESFRTLAELHRVPVHKLIEFNFPGSVEEGRVNPAIVNWYLHHHEGFRCPMTRDCLNRIFKGGERVAIPYLGTLTLGEMQFRGVRGMKPEDKVEEAIRRSLPLLPEELREQLKAMLTPEALAIAGTVLVAWAASHFFGIGEIVDIILLIGGFVLLGTAVFSGAEEFYDFATTAVNAKSDAELDAAAQHFAKAVNILGIAVIQALLMRGSVKAVAARGMPKVRGMPNVGRPPAAGARITRPYKLPSGALGECDWWGNIAVIRNQTLAEQRLTLLHEWVHSVLSPRLGPLRQLRAQLKASAYWRSALMQYLEEALAESFAQVRLNGWQNILVGIRFPIEGGYVTLAQLAAEGVAIGNIVLGGLQFNVTVVEGDWASAK